MPHTLHTIFLLEWSEMNVLLIGYRGSGKSTVGKELASQLWKQFVDLDQLVCDRFGGKTIQEIWVDPGEQAFRAMEARVMGQVLASDNQVVALGGGTVMVDEARCSIEQAEHAVCIYLKCSADELHRRIDGDQARQESRPASATARLPERVETELEQREPVYEQVADHVFDVTYVEPNEVVRYLIQRCL